MAIKQIYKQKWLLIPLSGVILLGVIALGINLFLQHPPFQRYLLTRIASGSGYTLQADDFGIRYNDGVEFWAAHLKVKVRHSGSSIAADETKLTFDLMALLKGRLSPRRLEMETAQFEIVKTSSQKPAIPSWGIDHKSTVRTIPMESVLSRIPSDIRLTNTALKVDGIDYQLNEADISVKQNPDNAAIRDVVISSRITTPSESANLDVNGWIALTNQTDTNKIGALNINIDQLPLGHLPKSNYFFFHEGLATLAVNLSIDKNGVAISNGTALLTNPNFVVQKKIRQKTYAMAQAELNFDARLTATSMVLNPVTIKTPDATLLCSYGFNWKDIQAPTMDLVVSSDEMPLATLKSIFPTPVIPGLIKSDIFPIFTSGTARLKEFSLKGPLAAIQRLGLRENAGSLYLGVEIIDSIAFQERPGPVVNNVSGRIRIKDGALLISDVSGKTGDSQLTRSGYTIPDIYEHPAQHIIALAGEFDLTDIKAWHAQPVLPERLRNRLASFASFSGRANGEATLFLKGPKATGLTGDISLVDNIIERADTLLPLKIEQGRIQMPSDSAASIVAQGYWGRSSVNLNGSMDLNHFLLSLPRRYDDNAELDAHWNLNDLIQTVKQHDIGPDWLKQIKMADGSVQSSLKLRKTAQKKGWQYGGGTFEWQKINLDHPLLKKRVATQSGHLSLSENGAGQYAIKSLWGQSAFDLSGRFKDFFRYWSAKGETRLTTKDLAAVLTNTHFPVISADKPVPIEMDIDQANGKWSVLANLAMDGQYITIGDFTLAPPATGNRLHSELIWQKGRPVEVKELQWVHQKETLNVQGTFPTTDDQSTQFELVAKKFPLNQMGLRYKKNQKNLSGALTGKVNGTITGNRLDTLKINGPLKIQDTELPVSDTPLLKRGWDVDVTFNGAGMTVHPSTLPLATGELMKISGDLTGWKRIAGNLTVTLDKLYLDRWKKRLKTSGDQKQPSIKPIESKPTPWAIKPALDIAFFTPTVLWEDQSIGQLNADLRWINYDCYLDAIDLEAPDVAVNMSGRYGWPLSTQAGLSLLTYIHLVDIDSDHLLSGIGVNKNDIHGTLDLEGGLEIKGKTATEMAQTASGRFKSVLSDGYIGEPNILVKVLESISLENIFVKKPPDELKDQFYYKSIDADFILEKGILTTENFFMKSPAFNMGASGKLDMSTMDLNLILAAQPLNTLDAIVSRVPIAGHILTGKNKALLVYTFEVDGTLGNPKVHQKPFKNLDKAVVGYFQRIFFTPTRVISRVGNYLKDIAEKIKTARPDPKSNSGDH